MNFPLEAWKSGLAEAVNRPNLTFAVSPKHLSNKTKIYIFITRIPRGVYIIFWGFFKKFSHRWSIFTDIRSFNIPVFIIMGRDFFPRSSLAGEKWAYMHVDQGGRRGGGGSYFPYILLNEIQTMFSQLAKRSAKVLLADLCTNHAHYVKIHRSTTWPRNDGLRGQEWTVLKRNENMTVEGGTVSHYYILVNIKNIL